MRNSRDRRNIGGASGSSEAPIAPDCAMVSAVSSVMVPLESVDDATFNGVSSEYTEPSLLSSSRYLPG